MNRLAQFFLAALSFCLSITASAQEPVFEGLREINGTNLFVRIYGQGDPLIVIHGGPGVNHAYFLPHLLPLADSNNIIFYDQRSCGRSAISNNIPNLAFDNMLADIEALKDSLGLKKVNIMAHSWGARLALGYALKYPASVSSVVLVSPIVLNHDYDKLQMEKMKEKTEPEDEIIQDNIVHSDEFKNGDKETYDKLLKLNFKSSFFNKDNLAKLNLDLPDNFLDANKMFMMGMRADMAAYDKNMYPELKAVKAPVLVIHGDADNIPLEADEKLVASLPSAKLVQFDSSGHFSFIEQNEKFVKTVNAFLHPSKEGK